MDSILTRPGMKPSTADDASPTDRFLIERALEGNQAAFEKIVERYWRLVYVIGYAHTGSRESAEDLTQEIFLRIYLNLKKFDLERPFTPWLSRVARNLSINWARSGKRHSSMLVHLPDGMMEQLPPDPAKESESAVMAKNEEAEMIRLMVFRLPADQRELVLLHYMEELSKKEIADKLGVHASTVGRQLKAALKTLRGEVEGALTEGVRGLRPPSHVFARTMSLVGAAAALGAEAKTALATAAGALPSGGGAFGLQSAGAMAAGGIAPLMLWLSKLGVLALAGIGAVIGVDEVRREATGIRPMFSWLSGDPTAEAEVAVANASDRAVESVRSQFDYMQEVARAADFEKLMLCYDIETWARLTGLELDAMRERVRRGQPGMAKLIAAGEIQRAWVDSEDPIVAEIQYKDGRAPLGIEIPGPIIGVRAGDWQGRFALRNGAWRVIDQQVVGESAEKGGVIHDMILVRDEN